MGYDITWGNRYIGQPAAHRNTNYAAYRMGQNQRHYATTPNSAPIPAVVAIASAPQKVTRATAFVTGALPTRAETPPSKARDPRDVIETMIGMSFSGESNAVTSGNAAPTANVAAKRALPVPAGRSSFRRCLIHRVHAPLMHRVPLIVRQPVGQAIHLIRVWRKYR